MVPGSIPGRPTKKALRTCGALSFGILSADTDFVFSWEFPAALIGAASVAIAAGAAVWAVARSSHGPSHAELLALGVLAAVGLWSWDTRTALAKRFFPDASGVVEESVAGHMLDYSDCAAYVARIGKGHDDGALCTIDVPSSVGRYVSPLPPPHGPESPCDVLAVPEVRRWTFAKGSTRDWCRP